MARKVTINDLARAAETSVTTVSQILNGKGQRFSNETRHRVLRLKDELKYVPDFNARSLITKSSQTIGVLVPNIGNPFFSTMLKGIQKVARDNDFMPIILSGNHDMKLENYYLKSLVERSVTGLIIASANITAKAIDEILKPANISYQLIDQNTVSLGDRVRTDDFTGGKLVAQHLLELGHQRIAIVLPPDRPNNLERRLEGFKHHYAAVAAGKFTANVTLVESAMTKQGGYEATDQVISTQSTAVFAINDEMAIGLYRGFKERGLTVPDDISVMGYDDIDLSQYVSPQLTTIHQPIYELGQQAAELLVKRIAAPHADNQVAELPVELVVRKSTKRLR